MKKCAFCTKPADSREHIFSEWMLNMLPAAEWQLRERLDSGEYKTYLKKKIKLRAKVVCHACNNRWMSDLEANHMKPAVGDILLGNNASVLQAKEIATIAAYGFKTTVIANHKSLTETPFFSASDRFRFRKTLRVPDGVQVWIACRKSTRYRGNWVSMIGKADRKHSLGFGYYTCTWNFQNLVIQTLCGKWDNKRRRKSVSFPILAQHDHWSHASIQVWPPDGDSVAWPPALYLSDDAYQTFSNRWNTITFDHVNMRFSTPI